MQKQLTNKHNHRLTIIKEVRKKHEEGLSNDEKDLKN
jgi:hypothetical protein